MWKRVERADHPAWLELLIPDGSGDQGPSLGDLLTYISERRSELDAHVSRTGAVLFRGFAALNPANCDGPTAFGRFARAFGPDLAEYIGGGSPRTALGDGLYTSTEYPKQLHIQLHLEGSYLPKMPTRLFFYCHTPPRTDGQTPLGDMAQVHRSLPEDLIRPFAEHGVSYIQNLRGGKGFGKSWQQVFLTEDRGQVEEQLVAGGYQFTWRNDGSLQTKITRPGVMLDLATGQVVWLNQAINWHPSDMPPETRARLRDLYREESLFPKYVTFGNGERIPDATMDRVGAQLRAAEWVFSWEAGDVLVVNNQRIAHGRQTYDGERRILVAMS